MECLQNGEMTCLLQIFEDSVCFFKIAKFLFPTGDTTKSRGGGGEGEGREEGRGGRSFFVKMFALRLCEKSLSLEDTFL
jgi:hypothetical protein